MTARGCGESADEVETAGPQPGASGGQGLSFTAVSLSRAAHRVRPILSLTLSPPSAQASCAPPPIPLSPTAKGGFLKHNTTLLAPCSDPAVPGGSPAPWPEKQRPSWSVFCFSLWLLHLMLFSVCGLRTCYSFPLAPSPPPYWVQRWGMMGGLSSTSTALSLVITSSVKPSLN